MKRLIRYAAVGAGVGFVTLVLSLSSARPAVAQLAQPTHQAILDAIAAFRASVDSALSGIQTSVNTLVAEGQSNVRVTPPLAGAAQRCSFVNVSSTPKTVESQLWQISAHAIRATHTQTINPGDGFEIGFALGGPYYCVFTVQDGSKSDIRGSLQVSSDSAFSAGFAAVSAE